MDKDINHIKNKILSLIELAADNNIIIEQAILFGSYAKGSNSEYSDIDIALVSDNFSGIRLDDNIRLMDIVLKIDHNIETHPFRPEDFTPDNLFVREILKQGIRIV